jgi:hypothetical protein
MQQISDWILASFLLSQALVSGEVMRLNVLISVISLVISVVLNRLSDVLC